MRRPEAASASINRCISVGILYNMGMSRIEMRNQKRRDVVGAIVNRKEPIHVVARVFNVPHRTVFEWLSWFRAEGWDGMNEKERSGRPRKLSGAQIKWVYDCITLGNPQQFNFEFCLWTLKVLRELIRSRLKVELSTSSLSRLLRKLGLSAQAGAGVPGLPEGSGTGHGVPERDLSGSDGTRQGHGCAAVFR